MTRAVLRRGSRRLAVGASLAIGAVALTAVTGCTPTAERPITVAVIDTGADTRLAQFEAYAISQESAEPSGGHGTMVLSVILGVADGQSPLPADEVRIVSLDVGGDAAPGDLARAIDEALEAEADVISISMGSRRGSPALESAVLSAAEADIPIVAAAGNVRFLAPDYPARYDTVMSVGAVDAAGDLWSQSATAGVDVTALGVDVPVVRSDGAEGVESGTSFAAAIVTHDIVAEAVAGR